jgi:hypothetical protein
MYLGGVAHEVVIVDAFTALAGPDVGKHLGQAAVGSGVNERGAVGVVFGAADGDGGGIAVGVIVKGTVRYAAVSDVRCHGKSSSRLPRAGGSVGLP